LSFRVVRSAQARWQGALPEGSGRITLGQRCLRRSVCTARALTGTEITLEASVAG
jgi:ABC-type Fe2+-enterobactin transport system substrate-binding protein